MSFETLVKIVDAEDITKGLFRTLDLPPENVIVTSKRESQNFSS